MSPMNALHDLGQSLRLDNITRDFPNYAAGATGPAAADELLERDGRAWRPLD